MRNIYGLIMIIDNFFNAISQVILKKSANETRGKSFLKKLMNKKVFIAYVIFGLVMLVNLYAYRGVDFKYGGALGATGQVFVLLLSVLLCNEKLTRNRLIGNILIVAGVIIYSIK